MMGKWRNCTDSYLIIYRTHIFGTPDIFNASFLPDAFLWITIRGPSEKSLCKTPMGTISHKICIRRVCIEKNTYACLNDIYQLKVGNFKNHTIPPKCSENSIRCGRQKSMNIRLFFLEDTKDFF